jgi:HK97 gp10 family phage protein
MDELRAAINDVMGAMDDKEVANIMLEGAKVVKTAIKRGAPRGPTGNLKKAVKAKKAKRWQKHRPSAWAAVDRKKAPHAHLVENGHAVVMGGKLGEGGRVVGHVPANPFVRRAAESTRSQVRAVVVKGLANGLKYIKKRRARRKAK